MVLLLVSPLMVLYWSASADHMRVCQSGLTRRFPLIAFRGDGGGEVEGDWGICCHWSDLTAHFSLINRRFGDLDFHGADLILSRMVNDKSSLFLAK